MSKPNHLLSIADLKPAEITAILDNAAEMKADPAGGKPLAGKTLAMLFAKPSTRTRVSFEAAMTQLGGHAIYLGMGDLQLGRGETIADTARVLSGYANGVVARLFKHDDLLELAKNSKVPVINGLTDLLHPCQILADLLTIREKKGELKGLKLAYVGDGNNVCNSLILGCAKTGIDISVATPEGYAPDAGVLKQAKGAKVVADPNEAVTGADVVYTDTFVSMGQEDDRERKLKEFKGYQVDAKLMGVAKPDAIFMHCLPAHRGEEVAAEVIDGPQSAVFDQAENRLHAQKAILVRVM